MIKLRYFQQSDSKKLVRALNNPSVYQFLSSKIPNPYSEADASWWIETGSRYGHVRAIVINNELVGCIGVYVGEFEYCRSGEIGYWISDDYWGKGIATDAVNRLIDEIFIETDIVRITASVFSGNYASMKVLTKCRFKLDAVLEQAIYKDNQFYNNHLFSRIKS